MAPLLARRSVASSLLALSALPSPQPLWAALDARCLQEVAIQGAYVSPCMSEKSRTFSWQSVGEVAIEQGEVGPGTTGAAVWNAGAYLADYLATAPAELLKGRNVVELGCGAGLCGVVAARRGASRVLLTDGSEAVLARAARNIERNGGGGAGDVLSTKQLQWGSVLDDSLVGAFDVVIGSDVLYQSSAWRPFAQTAIELLAPRGGTLILAEAGHAEGGGMQAREALGSFQVVAEPLGLRFDEPSGGDAGGLVVEARLRT